MSEKEFREVVIEKLEKFELLFFGNDKVKGIFERVRNLEIFYKIGLLISFGLNIFLAVLQIRGG